MELKNSKTAQNLMRAFAGESQARNRYTFAAEAAEKNNLPVIACLFKFTAEQEKVHARVFYDYLKELAGENIHIEGAYPVEEFTDTAAALKKAQHNELEEANDVYISFAQTAEEEGFTAISTSFRNIAEVEKTHANRFEYFADLASQNKIFEASEDVYWMCLECGYIYKGTKTPIKCPVCREQGHFVKLSLAPFTE